MTAAALTWTVTAPASAAPAEGAVLTAATVDVRPQPESSSASVREEISVSGVTEGEPVRNLLTRFDGVRVVGLTVTADGEPVEPQTGQDGDMTTVTFPSPVSGELTYTVSYRVETSAGAHELPLLVPPYASSERRVVAFSYRIPDGYHLQGSPFPVQIGETGNQERQLLGVPTFLDYRLGTEPPGPFTPVNLLGVTVVVLVAGLTVLVFVRDARAGRRGGRDV